jgi:biotin carboxyl carrier protein
VNLDPEQIRQLIKLIETSGWDHAKLESEDLSLMLSKGPAHEASTLFRSDSAQAPPTVSHQDPATYHTASRAVADDPADRSGEQDPAGPQTAPSADGLVFVTATSDRDGAGVQSNHGAAYSRSSMLGSSMFLTMSCTVSARSLVHR